MHCPTKPPPAVEFNRQALGGAPHRLGRDRVHFDPLSPANSGLSLFSIEI
jgi:hypothetical protein